MYHLFAISSEFTLDFYSFERNGIDLNYEERHYCSLHHPLLRVTEARQRRDEAEATHPYLISPLTLLVLILSGKEGLAVCPALYHDRIFLSV